MTNNEDGLHARLDASGGCGRAGGGRRRGEYGRYLELELDFFLVKLEDVRLGADRRYKRAENK